VLASALLYGLTAGAASAAQGTILICPSGPAGVHFTYDVTKAGNPVFSNVDAVGGACKLLTTTTTGNFKVTQQPDPVYTVTDISVDGGAVVKNNPANRR